MIRLVEAIDKFLAGNCNPKIPCSSDFYMNTVTPSFSFCFHFLELVSITVRRDKCLCCCYVRFSSERCILWRINPYRICIYIQQHAKCVYISLQLEEKVLNSPPPPLQLLTVLCMDGGISTCFDNKRFFFIRI